MYHFLNVLIVNMAASSENVTMEMSERHQIYINSNKHSFRLVSILGRKGQLNVSEGSHQPVIAAVIKPLCF